MAQRKHTAPTVPYYEYVASSYSGGIAARAEAEAADMGELGAHDVFE